MARILIIDDDELICTTLTRLVSGKGHDASSALNLLEGLRQATAQACDVIFLDVRLPDGNGLDLLPKIEALPLAPEVIIMTGFGDPNGAELAIKCGAWDYIEKNSSVKDIVLSLERALQYRQEKLAVAGRQSVAALQREKIVGHSPKLQICLDQVAQAAGSEVNVCLFGETGTGKELFARAIHENSQRRRGNFVVVDCTALPETLVESLLFGHEKGSFTGADKARDGLVLQAHCGTLFLDEVGELPLSLQKTFLRVLQERRFRPLGGARELASDFRLVVATNRNLEAMVESGQFRADLLFRLKSYCIELPALRERHKDVQQLARFYADRFSLRYGLAPKGFSPEFLETLTGYAWPGNVRELVNCMEQTLAAAQAEPTLFPKHLPLNIRIQVTRATVSHAGHSQPHADKNSVYALPKLHDYREAIYNDAEKSYLHDLFSRSERNISHACQLSGLSPSRLYALMKKHEISRID
ncbi:MAG: sigma-54 dependent transcriptional regulator [Desulfuromonadales bacterium]|nr:sigma-54 dependent transcriptional regulator [Desulfuromonadales bacterium]